MQSNDEVFSRITSFRLGEFARHCNELLQAASSSSPPRSLTQIFSELLEGIRHNLHFDHLGLGLYNSSANVLDIMLQAGEEQMPPAIPVLSDSLGVVLEEQKAIEVHDVERESNFADLCSRASSGGFRSFRVVPLSTDRQRLGAVAVLRRQPGHFSEEDVRYLNHAAQLIALVLENTLMADVLGREKARLEMLLDVNSALVSQLDLQKLFREVSDLLRRVVNQDYTHFALYEPTSDAMKFYILGASNEPAVLMPESVVPISECPAGICYRQGQMMQFNSADLELIGSDYTKNVLACGVRTLTCFPLISRGRKLGTLGLASSGDDMPSQDDCALLTQIAAQVAIAIDNARAYDEIAKLKDKLSKEKLYLEEELRSQHNFGEVVGNSSSLREVLQQVEIAAPSQATVLVLGETGTGKELIARAVHRLSSRREGNFIKLNCAAIPTGLLESELFGHEKGAFTGAISQKVGRLELADKGTLFLDEIGEIPMELQPKLLRVLQDHEFERLGGVRTIRVNVRLVAATNRDLTRAVEQHQFRSDLYYRLNVFPIKLPPLRERRGDIPLLARYFVQKFARRMSKNIESIPSEIIQALEQWPWPGNIRELENFLERSVILTRGPALFAPLPELRLGSPSLGRSFGNTLEAVEREYILRSLREAGGVIAGVHGAAARLGMKRSTLQSRMQRLGITREEYEM